MSSISRALPTIRPALVLAGLQPGELNYVAVNEQPTHLDRAIGVYVRRIDLSHYLG